MKRTCMLLFSISLLGIDSVSALGAGGALARGYVRPTGNTPVQRVTQQNGNSTSPLQHYLTGKTWVTPDGIELREANVPVTDNTCGYAAVDQNIGRVLRDRGRSSKSDLIDGIIRVIDGSVDNKQYQIKTAIAQEICQGLQNEERLQTGVAWPDGFLEGFVAAHDEIDFCRRSPEALKAYLDFCKRNPRMAEVIIPDGGLLVASAYVQDRNLVVVARGSGGNVRIRNGRNTTTYADGQVIAQYTAIPNAPLLFVYYNGTGNGGHFTRLER